MKWNPKPKNVTRDPRRSQFPRFQLHVPANRIFIWKLLSRTLCWVNTPPPFIMVLNFIFLLKRNYHFLPFCPFQKYVGTCTCTSCFLIQFEMRNVFANKISMIDSLQFLSSKKGFLHSCNSKTSRCYGTIQKCYYVHTTFAPWQLSVIITSHSRFWSHKKLWKLWVLCGVSHSDEQQVCLCAIFCTTLGVAWVYPFSLMRPIYHSQIDK